MDIINRNTKRKDKNILRRFFNDIKIALWRWWYGSRAQPDQTSLSVIMRGFAAFQVLLAATRIGLFRALGAGPDRTVEELRDELKIPDHSLRALLLACTSLGLIVRRKHNGAYRNAKVIGQAMTSTQAGSKYVAQLEAWNYLMYKPFYFLTESLQQGKNIGLQVFPGTGDTLYDRLEDDSTGKRFFYQWMNTFKGVPDSIVEALRETHHLLDVGGGDAGNAIELVRQLPNLKITIVDLPRACEIAAANVAAAGLSGRIETSVTQDFIGEDFPDSVDAILFAHIFNIYSDDINRALVEKSARALLQGGKLLIYNMVSADSQTGDWHAGFMSLYFQALATGSGFVYPRSSYIPWFTKAGFKTLSLDTAEWGEAIFIGTK